MYSSVFSIYSFFSSSSSFFLSPLADTLFFLPPSARSTLGSRHHSQATGKRKTDGHKKEKERRAKPPASAPASANSYVSVPSLSVRREGMNMYAESPDCAAVYTVVKDGGGGRQIWPRSLRPVIRRALNP